jgi:hypothetical protein
MKRWILNGLVGFGVVGLLWSSATPAQAQPPASFRPTSSGVGFFSRNYRSPGFSTIPAPPRYNAVSFYGRSFNAPGFSPIPPGQLMYVPGNYGFNSPAPSAPVQGSSGQGVSYGWHYGPSVLSYQPGVYSDYASYALGTVPPG